MSWRVFCTVGTLLGVAAGSVLGFAVWVAGNTDGLQTSPGPAANGVITFVAFTVMGLAGGAVLAGVANLRRRHRAPS